MPTADEVPRDGGAVAGYRLPVSSPSAEGVDAEGIIDFVDALAAAPGTEPHSLMVLRHGQVVAAGWWAPYSVDGLQLLYSLSKSFTGTAAALAADEGLLRFDDPVLSYFPELDAVVTRPRSRSVLVRHIASMASGHVEDTWEKVAGAAPDEPVRAFLQWCPEEEPGSVFAYNQSATYTLAAIVQRVTGETLTSYLRRRLFDALGIGEVAWQKDRLGRQLGFSGLYATTGTVARLGELYLRRGSWHGRQLLRPEWVADASRPQVATTPRADLPGAETTPDWEQGYGYQFWMSRHGYRGDGAYGQFCLVLPEQDAVVAMTAQTLQMQAVLDLAWDKLLPALSAEAGERACADADARLSARLLGLQVPALALPYAAPPLRPEDWAGARFLPQGGRCQDQPSLQAVGVSAGSGGWGAVLEEKGWRLEAPLGKQGWHGASAVPCGEGGGVPVASSGGWESTETMRCDLMFLESPHRLAVACHMPGRTFEAGWVTAPLHCPKLAGLRAPAERG
ncbi:MAG: serine hydrolase domain-containing protein [Acidimicrobiales bacterium]